MQKQITEVERQALRSQMNPHFIFNALNTIQGNIAQGDKLAANRYLSRFAKLTLSALQHSRVTKVPLDFNITGFGCCSVFIKIKSDRAEDGLPHGQ